MNPETKRCFNCNEPLTGLITAGTSEFVDETVCPRCGFVNFTLHLTGNLLKQAGPWDSIKDALRLLGPAIGVLGVWDLTVAYNSLKKVLENAARSQSATSFNPYFASKKASAEPTIKLTEVEEFIVKLAPVATRQAMDDGDMELLKALAMLGKAVSAAKKQYAISQEMAGKDYSHQYLD